MIDDKDKEGRDLLRKVGEQLAAKAGHHDELMFPQLFEYQQEMLDRLKEMDITRMEIPSSRMPVAVVHSTPTGRDQTSVEELLNRMRETSLRIRPRCTFEMVRGNLFMHPQDALIITGGLSKTDPDLLRMHFAKERNFRTTRNTDVVFNYEAEPDFSKILREMGIVCVDEIGANPFFKNKEDIRALRVIYDLNMGGDAPVEERHEKACTKILGKQKKRRKAVRKILDGFYLEDRETERAESRMDAENGQHTASECEPRRLH